MGEATAGSITDDGCRAGLLSTDAKQHAAVDALGGARYPVEAL